MAVGIGISNLLPSVFSASDYAAPGQSRDVGPELNSALAQLSALGGGQLVFGLGTWLIATILTVPSNVRLVGLGRGLSVIKQRDGANLAALISATSASQIGIEDLTVDGNKAANTTRCTTVVFNACTDIDVVRIEVRNTPGGSPTPGVGISIGGASLRVLIDGCYVRDCGTLVSAPSDAIYASGKKIRVVNNVVESCTDTGIVFEAVSTSSADPDDQTVIAGNSISGTPQAIAVDAAVAGTVTAGVTIAFNTIEGASAVNGGAIFAFVSAGFSLNGVSIVGNVVRGSTDGHAIYCSFLQDATIVGNTVLSCSPTVGKHGILIERCDRITCTGNTVRNGGGNGIAVLGSTVVTLNGNVISENSQAASGVYSGIAVGKSGTVESFNVTIVGNKSTGALQGRGLAITDGSDNLMIEGNDFRFNLNNPGLLNSSTGTNIRLGYNASNNTIGAQESIGALILPAGIAVGASLRLPHGNVPTTPVDGDMWTTSSGLFVRVNGVTKTVTLT